MRTRLSYLACLATVFAVGVASLPATAVAAPRDPAPSLADVARLPLIGSPVSGAGSAEPAPTAARAVRPSDREQLVAEMRLPSNFARLLARFAGIGDDPVRVHRQLRRDTRQEGLGEYVHIGPLHGRRFTVTVISDQACARVAPRPHGVESGPCIPADQRASLTPLQDSAELLTLAVADMYGHGSRAGAVREVFPPMFLRFYGWLIAPHGVRVTGIADRDDDGLDDDGRVAFRANGKTVCASLPLSAKAQGAVTYGSCQRLRPREVRVHERMRAVFREMKQGADIGAYGRSVAMEKRVRRAARIARLISSHPEAATRIMGDRVQFRARVNDRIRFACYHVSPEGKRATYSRSGEPGTWRLGHCR